MIKHKTYLQIVDSLLEYNGNRFNQKLPGFKYAQ